MTKKERQKVLSFSSSPQLIIFQQNCIKRLHGISSMSSKSDTTFAAFVLLYPRTPFPLMYLNLPTNCCTSNETCDLSQAKDGQMKQFTDLCELNNLLDELFSLGSLSHLLHLRSKSINFILVVLSFLHCLQTWRDQVITAGKKTDRRQCWKSKKHIFRLWHLLFGLRFSGMCSRKKMCICFLLFT